MRHLLCSALFLGLTASAFAQSPLAGPTFGRVQVISLPGDPAFSGPAQQTIALPRGKPGVIMSTMVAASTPVALGITDRFLLRGSRLTFFTDFDPCGCEPTIRATGRVQVRDNVITYSARNEDADLLVSGRIRVRGRIIERIERRTQEGNDFRIRYVLYRR